MQTIKVSLPSDIKQAEIYIGSDWHIGDSFCDLDLIKSRIEYVREHDNCFMILNGDLMNNATKTSVSDSYAERIKPMDQLNLAVELLEPIKNKIIAITSGNHEDRTYIKEGIDLMQIVAQQLGIEDRYSKTGALIFLKLGNQKSHHKKRHGEDAKSVQQLYTIYCIHGSGGGRKEGAKAIRLADMASIIDADVYVHSHTHLPMIMKQSSFRVDKQNQGVKQVNKLFINTAATLNYGGYGEKYEFKPSSKDTPILYLGGSEFSMNAKL